MGGDAGLSFFRYHSDTLALADGNEVVLEILDSPTVEGRATADCGGLLMVVFGALSFEEAWVAARRQAGGRESTISFWEFLRVGFPVTLVTTVLGVLVLLAEHFLAGRIT